MSIGERSQLAIPLLVILAALGCSSTLAEEPGGGDASSADARRIAPGPPPLDVTVPSLTLRGIPMSIKVRATDELPDAELPVEIREEPGGRVLASGTLKSGTESTFDVAVSVPELSVHLPGTFAEGFSATVRVVPGWLSLLPPLLAISLALIFRQVVPALLGGVWIGAWIAHGDPWVGALRTLDGYVVGTLGDGDRVKIVVFSLMLGGMVGVISRAGGTIGLVESLAKHATTPRRGQLVTWLLGILVFFDDYANTLLVGNTMRPVTDRLKISREKLAYIVDSTAAPVASIALISTWIGYEVSLIADALKELGLEADAYSVFVQSLPYRFYPILALFFGLFIATGMRDFGPMLKAERRADRGKVLADGAVPLADFDNDALQAIEGKPRRWFNAVIPVLTVLVVTFVALWQTGVASLAADSSGAGPLFERSIQGIGSVFGAGNSFNALLYASFAGCIVALALAVGQRVLTVGEGLTAWVGGLKSMTVAIVILILAWSIADVCSSLNTSGFMVASLSDHLNPRLLPMLVFVVAALTSFSTGTSWGTMGILIPLAVPTAHGLAAGAGFDPLTSHGILLGAVSSVLAGAIFGDHCSPISDTTVLSSMASGCDHVHHVRTQLPYAVTVGVVGIVIGDLPSAYGVSPYICILVGAGILVAIVRWVGRPVAA